MGQAEQIGEGGLIVKNVSEYAGNEKFMNEKDYYKLVSKLIYRNRDTKFLLFRCNHHKVC